MSVRRDGQVAARRSARAALAKQTLPRAPPSPTQGTVRPTAGPDRQLCRNACISFACLRSEASSSGGESEFEDAVESQDQLGPGGTGGSPAAGEFDYGDGEFDYPEAGAEKEAEEAVPLVRGWRPSLRARWPVPT